MGVARLAYYVGSLADFPKESIRYPPIIFQGKKQRPRLHLKVTDSCPKRSVAAIPGQMIGYLFC